ncbi:MAG: amidohydrolase family protein [Gammaproteobacteria bacterium]|nr:amidohydrolase family protein [Gammaproteobacteria bacterium]
MLTLRLLLFLFVAATSNAHAIELAFENITVLDPATESSQAGTLLVRNGHVVGLVDSVPSDFQGRRIDLGGRWVIPGLVDMHTHAGGNRSPDGQIQFMTPAQVAQIALYAGVVAYLDLFNVGEDFVFGFRNEQRQTGVAAKIYAAGPCLTATDGHCTEYGFPTRIVNTPADARREIDELARKAPDVIKVVYATGGVALQPTIDRQTLDAVVTIAREHGLKTVVHVESWGDVRDSVLAGAAAVTHTPFNTPPPDIAPLMIKHGTVHIPTLVVQNDIVGIVEEPALLDDELLVDVVMGSLLDAYRGNYPAQMEGWLSWSRRHKETDALAIRMLSSAGVPMLTGTDASNLGAFQGYSVHRELELLVAAGLTNWEALRAGTTAPRDFLDGRWGVSVGDEATFVVLNGSPLDDIRNTKRIHMVVQHGTIVDRNALLSSGLGCTARSIAEIDFETLSCTPQNQPQ